MQTLYLNIPEGPHAHMLAAERLELDVKDALRFHGVSGRVSSFWDDVYMPDIEDSTVEYGVKIELAGSLPQGRVQEVLESIAAHCATGRFSAAIG